MQNEIDVVVHRHWGSEKTRWKYRESCYKSPSDIRQTRPVCRVGCDAIVQLPFTCHPSHPAVVVSFGQISHRHMACGRIVSSVDYWQSTTMLSCTALQSTTSRSWTVCVFRPLPHTSSFCKRQGGPNLYGAAENAEVEISLYGQKCRMKNAAVEISAPSCRGGKTRVKSKELVAQRLFRVPFQLCWLCYNRWW